MGNQPVRVLIVDDSASVRQILSTILAEDPAIEIMGTASDPYAAARRLQNELPDVIILDIEMPRMDGITFLRKIMAQHPIPVIICSSVTEEGSNLMFEAFEAGAVDIVPKPRIDTRQALLEITGQRDFLENNPQLGRSIRDRLPYLDPLNHLQLELLHRCRGGYSNEVITRALHITVNGIASALRNSG